MYLAALLMSGPPDMLKVRIYLVRATFPLTRVFGEVPLQWSLHEFHFEDVNLVQKQDD